MYYLNKVNTKNYKLNLVKQNRQIKNVKVKIKSRSNKKKKQKELQ